MGFAVVAILPAYRAGAGAVGAHGALRSDTPVFMLFGGLLGGSIHVNGNQASINL